jgi:hypothetical protein
MLPYSTFPFSADEDFASQTSTNVAGEKNPVEGSASDAFKTFLIDHKLVLTIKSRGKVEKSRGRGA